MGKIHDMLLSVDKKNIFDFTTRPSVGYPSGLYPLDYSNGYWVKVLKNVEPGKDRWLNVGTQGGTFYTVIGNSGVGKSALCIAMGSSMIRPFEYGEYYHTDAEGTSNTTRIQQLNRFSNEEMEEKYHFPNVIYVEDQFTLIYNLAQLKIKNKEFAYDTGYLDQNGDPIIIPQPTAVLIDSLPSMQTKDVEDQATLGSQTYNMRLAIAYNTFYKRLRPIIRDANITVFAINHIKEKPQMGFVKTQAKIQYLKPDESIPGGSGPIYYSQNLLRVIYRGKYVKDKHGFDGFLVEALNIKSKTNKSGTSVHLVFHAQRGFEPILTLLKMADDLDLIKGRNPYSYLSINPDHKFNTKDIDEILKDETLAKMLVESCQPYLMAMVGELVNFSDKDMNPAELMNRINKSYETKDMDKADIVKDTIESTGIRTAACKLDIIKKFLKKVEKKENLFKGVHRYHEKGMHKVKNPEIENYMHCDEYSAAYKKYCLNEMRYGSPYIRLG